MDDPHFEIMIMKLDEAVLHFLFVAFAVFWAEQQLEAGLLVLGTQCL